MQLHQRGQRPLLLHLLLHLLLLLLLLLLLHLLLLLLLLLLRTMLQLQPLLLHPVLQHHLHSRIAWFQHILQLQGLGWFQQILQLQQLGRLPCLTAGTALIIPEAGM